MAASASVPAFELDGYRGGMTIADVESHVGKKVNWKTEVIENAGTPATWAVGVYVFGFCRRDGAYQLVNVQKKLTPDAFAQALAEYNRMYGRP
jgi:hypothetical protein